MLSISQMYSNQKSKSPPNINKKDKNICPGCNKNFRSCRCNTKMYNKCCILLNVLLLIGLVYMLCKYMSNSPKTREGPFRLVKRY